MTLISFGEFEAPGGVGVYTPIPLCSQVDACFGCTDTSQAVTQQTRAADYASYMKFSSKKGVVSCNQVCITQAATAQNDRDEHSIHYDSCFSSLERQGQGPMLISSERRAVCRQDGTPSAQVCLPGGHTSNIHSRAVCSCKFWQVCVRLQP